MPSWMWALLAVCGISILIVAANWTYCFLIATSSELSRKPETHRAQILILLCGLQWSAFKHWSMQTKNRPWAWNAFFVPMIALVGSGIVVAAIGSRHGTAAGAMVAAFLVALIMSAVIPEIIAPHDTTVASER